MSRFDQKRTIQTLVANRDVLKGVKVLSSQRHSGNLDIVPTKLAVQAARESGTHVMAHIGQAPPLILWMGRLIPHKDPAALIRAAARLKAFVERED